MSYIPVPLSSGISDRGAFGYSRMRGFGPNDGLTMLVDQLLPGGVAILEPGVDHYFDHPDRELRSLALLEVLMKRVGAASPTREDAKTVRGFVSTTTWSTQSVQPVGSSMVLR